MGALPTSTPRFHPFEVSIRGSVSVREIVESFHPLPCSSLSTGLAVPAQHT
jgi:hypothetical protein